MVSHISYLERTQTIPLIPPYILSARWQLVAASKNKPCGDPMETLQLYSNIILTMNDAPFQLDASILASVADAVNKIQQSIQNDFKSVHDQAFLRRLDLALEKNFDYIRRCSVALPLQILLNSVLLKMTLQERRNACNFKGSTSTKATDCHWQANIASRYAKKV